MFLSPLVSLKLPAQHFLAFGYGSNNPTIAISSQGPIIYFACDGNFNQSGELPFCDINVWYNLTITQVSLKISIALAHFRFTSGKNRFRMHWKTKETEGVYKFCVTMVEMRDQYLLGEDSNQFIGDVIANTFSCTNNKPITSGKFSNHCRFFGFYPWKRSFMTKRR